MSRAPSRADWHPASWQSLNAAQQPTYPDQERLERAVADLSRLPPLVTSWEIDALREQIAAVWSRRRDRYSEQRAGLDDARRASRRIEMYEIGG